MAENSTIEWTDHTFNPWQGCTKIHEGCKNCYAESGVRRDLRGKLKREAERRDIPLDQLARWGPDSVRQFPSEEYWREPSRWNRKAAREGRRKRVFCASMGDIFEDRRDLDDPRERLFRVIEETTYLDWLMLTKRPESIARMVPQHWLDKPLRNVWYGTSPCNSRTLTGINDLIQVPAAVRFVSVEPLVGLIPELPLKGIHGVIVGGESGVKTRPCLLEWVREVRDQTKKANKRFFFKQWGKLKNNPDKNDPTAKENGGKAKGGRMLDGRIWDELPFVG